MNNNLDRATDLPTDSPLDNVFLIISVAEEIYDCIERGDLAGAICHLDRAISLYPERAYFYAERANLYSQMGDMMQAIADYDRAISLQPYNQLFQYWRSELDDWNWHIDPDNIGPHSSE
jgi:tetratricopeptide (TPR) repeat protein